MVAKGLQEGKAFAMPLFMMFIGMTIAAILILYGEDLSGRLVELSEDFRRHKQQKLNNRQSFSNMTLTDNCT